MTFLRFTQGEILKVKSIDIRNELRIYVQLLDQLLNHSFLFGFAMISVFDFHQEKHDFNKHFPKNLPSTAAAHLFKRGGCQAPKNKGGGRAELIGTHPTG